MLDGEDRSEQSQEDYQYATRMTMKNAALNPVLKWAKTGKLNSVLEGSVLSIRKAITYLRSDTGMQSLDYYSLDCRGGRSTSRVTDEAYEPKDVRRYLDWSPKIINKYGQGGFRLVTDSILDGAECDWDLFHSAIKLY